MSMSVSGLGLIVGFQRQAVTANNVANAQTPGYQAQRAELAATAGGGVRVAAVSRDTRPGPLVFDAILVGMTEAAAGRGLRGYLELSNVDLSREMVDQVLTKTQVTANARALRSQSDTFRTTLDLLG